MVDLQKKAHQLRNDVLEMCIKAGTGHVTSCFSCVEIMVALFYGIMKEGDKFLLSKGHASPLLYAILADKGIIPKEELDKFCQSDSILGVHLDHNVDGVECTFGSLGYGLGIGCGMALADRKHNVYVLLGDGECYEGSVWEAMMFAGQQKLSNLRAIVDYNGLMVTGKTDLWPFAEKWSAFQWHVFITDGHNLDSLTHIAEDARWWSKYLAKPHITIAETIKGKGIPFMENKALWHGQAPQGEDAERARRELNEISA